MGVATGLIGAGGNAGAAITTAIFFTPNSISDREGFRWMGVYILIGTLSLFAVYWPMWGSMLTRGNPEYHEEDYYSKDFTEEEKAKNMHRSVLKFASESRSNRGFSKVMMMEGTQGLP